MTMKQPVAPAPHRAPPLRAAPFLKSESDTAPLLTERQREDLARIGIRLRLPARMMVYREQSAATSVFAVADGVVKTYRDLPSGKRTIGAFLFARDLFGLAENGRYINCAQAVTRVTLYRLPLDELTRLLKHDADMQFQFLVKVTHELRESQRRAILMGRRDAAGRLAMFVMMMGKHADQAGKAAGIVPLPMTRSDIAGFLGLSLESISRAAAELERRGFVTFDRHLGRIVDPAGLARLAEAV